MNCCHCKALLNKGPDPTITRGQKKVFFMDNMYSRCASQQSTPSVQALAGKRVVTSLLRHSWLVALCLLAISHVDS